MAQVNSSFVSQFVAHSILPDRDAPRFGALASGLSSTGYSTRESALKGSFGAMKGSFLVELNVLQEVAKNDELQGIVKEAFTKRFKELESQLNAFMEPVEDPSELIRLKTKIVDFQNTVQTLNLQTTQLQSSTDVLNSDLEASKVDNTSLIGTLETKTEHIDQLIDTLNELKKKNAHLSDKNDDQSRAIIDLNDRLSGATETEKERNRQNLERRLKSEADSKRTLNTGEEEEDYESIEATRQREISETLKSTKTYVDERKFDKSKQRREEAIAVLRTTILGLKKRVRDIRATKEGAAPEVQTVIEIEATNLESKISELDKEASDIQDSIKAMSDKKKFVTKSDNEEWVKLVNALTPKDMTDEARYQVGFITQTERPDLIPISKLLAPVTLAVSKDKVNFKTVINNSIQRHKKFIALKWEVKVGSLNLDKVNEELNIAYKYFYHAQKIRGSDLWKQNMEASKLLRVMIHIDYLIQWHAYQGKQQFDEDYFSRSVLRTDDEIIKGKLKKLSEEGDMTKLIFPKEIVMTLRWHLRAMFTGYHPDKSTDLTAVNRIAMALGEDESLPETEILEGVKNEL